MLKNGVELPALSANRNKSGAVNSHHRLPHDAKLGGRKQILVAPIGLGVGP